MAKSLAEIAQELKSANKKVQLIYAFNGVGKTRLSREFRELVAPKNDNENLSEPSRDKIIYTMPSRKTCFTGIMIWMVTTNRS